jgi:hypothetical protein
MMLVHGIDFLNVRIWRLGVVVVARPSRPVPRMIDPLRADEVSGHSF